MSSWIILFLIFPGDVQAAVRLQAFELKGIFSKSGQFCISTVYLHILKCLFSITLNTQIHGHDLWGRCRGSCSSSSTITQRRFDPITWKIYLISFTEKELSALTTIALSKNEMVHFTFRWFAQHACSLLIYPSLSFNSMAGANKPLTSQEPHSTLKSNYITAPWMWRLDASVKFQRVINVLSSSLRIK